MDTWVKQSLFAAGVTVAVTVGLVVYEKHAMALPSAAAGGTSTVMTTQTLSLSGTKAVQIQLPPGGVLGPAVSLNPSVATVATGAGQTSPTITAVSVGATLVTISWTDSGGSPQKTTVPVTVTA